MFVQQGSPNYEYASATWMNLSDATSGWQDIVFDLSTTSDIDPSAIESISIQVNAGSG